MMYFKFITLIFLKKFKLPEIRKPFKYIKIIVNLCFYSLPPFPPDPVVSDLVVAS